MLSVEIADVVELGGRADEEAKVGTLLGEQAGDMRADEAGASCDEGFQMVISPRRHGDTEGFLPQRRRDAEESFLPMLTVIDRVDHPVHK